MEGKMAFLGKDLSLNLLKYKRIFTLILLKYKRIFTKLISLPLYLVHEFRRFL